MVKPDFWDDEKLATISRDARLTFIGLWNYSDDYGVVKGNPTWLKSKIYPYDDKLKLEAFTKWVDEIRQIKAILPFEAGCEEFYFIKNFLKHQRINRPSELRNPEPPADILEDSGSTQGALTDEVKLSISIKEVKEKQTRARAWPDDFILTDKMKEYAVNHNIDPKKTDLFFEDFKNWADQNEKTYKNWEAAFRNRVLKAPELGKQFLATGESQNALAHLRGKYSEPGKLSQEGSESGAA
jgi:hypothetical protein